jgi:hypothetical protein
MKGFETVKETGGTNKGSESKREFISRQSYGGRLAEYLTGIQLDDPRLIERLIDDQKILRAKYNLPLREMRLQLPQEYEKILMDIAHKHAVRIDTKSECGAFFIENSAGAVYLGDKRIGTDVNREDIDSYVTDLGKLEHELIHALQDIYSPRMPIELQEYEAYIAGLNLEHLQEKTDEAERIQSIRGLFEHLIGASVRWWYSNQTKIRETELKPEWDTPEYFSKNAPQS